jgi:hypothetical protein
VSYETVSTRLKDILDRIENVHNVHEYFRDIPDEAEFQKAFSVSTPDGTLLTAWMMTRNALQSSRPGIDAQAILDVTHRIEIQGFYGMEDAKQSELKFQEIIDNIIVKLRTKFLLEDEAGSPLTGVIKVNTVEVPEIGHGQFSSYFVHFARVLISVEERLQ